MKYIHLKCLIVWIKTKVEIDNSEYLENGKYVIYSSEKVECELCKEVFPNYVRHNNKLYNLMD
jgi:E3 ubiquitin-protein ligase DOA10